MAKAPLPGRVAPAVMLGRLALCLGLWIALIGTGLTDLAIGAAAAVVAAWLSLRLLPPAGRAISWRALAGFALRLAWQSLVAGIDVARRAFDPRMPLRTGHVAFPTRLPAGPARDVFRAAMSLQPGALPVSAETDGPILFHCLDTTWPVLAQLAAEEARFLRALGAEPRDA